MWGPVRLAVGGGLVWCVATSGTRLPPASSPAVALCDALRDRGLRASAGDVTWLDAPRGWLASEAGSSRALVRAATADEPADLYLAKVRRSPEGELLELLDVYDLTRTSGVDEARPVVRGHWAAYVTSIDDTATAVHTLDLQGVDPSTYADFTRVQRWQTALTNVQQTGGANGVVHNAFTLDPTATHVQLEWDDASGELRIDADGRRIAIDPARAVAVRGAGWVHAVPEEKARPGNLVTWSVDRVRAMPWFGDTRMQWLKATVFTGLDLALRVRAKLVDTSATDVAADLGNAERRFDVETHSDPDLHWPPPPLAPLLTPALNGEGRWLLLDQDPFITPAPGLPSAFVTTFVRTDRERPDTRVYVTLWDPRQLSLHMVAGTVEPVSASGEAGPGLIPRAPEVMRTLVAGFNGGFQALHGEYGMEADGIEYLPPKPYAATVLELRDGSTAFGAWPASPVVPDDVLSFRQNLTALVEDGKFNPWGRTWWGGTPPGWQDNIHTTRTGVCLTREGAVGYFFGADLSAEALGRGMLQAHCTFGVHLDMNPGLAGFEFYDVEQGGDFKSLKRPLQTDWEYEGTVRDLPDLRVRARRMTRGMQEVNFPQYIHREARDFFYLTRRPLLPGQDVSLPLPSADATEGHWRVKGLPQHGFPYAIATTSMHLDAAGSSVKVNLLRVDPRAIRPAASAGTREDSPTVLALYAPEHGLVRLWWKDEVFGLGASAPDGGLIVAAGVPPKVARMPLLQAMACVQDLDGMLDWLEVPGGDANTPALVDAADRVLASLGCSTRVAIETNGRALLGGVQPLDDARVPPPASSSPFVRFVRGDTPGARAYFADTPIVAPAVWQPLQSKRVRYFPKPAKVVPSGPPSQAPTPPPPAL